MQYEPVCIIKVYSHFFKVIRPTPRVMSLLRWYCSKHTSQTWVKERGKWVNKPDKLYGAHAVDNSEFRFHINQLKDFKDFLTKNHVQENLYQIEVVPIPEPVKCHMPMRNGMTPYEYQIPAIDYLVEDNGNRSKMVELQTGKGKGTVTLFGISQLGYRTVVMVKPQYMQKWADEIVEKMDQTYKNIMMVQGGDHLRGLIELAKNGQLHSNFIIISNRTYQNYLKAYESDPFGMEYLSYECHPEDLFPLLGAGCLLIDEVHQDFWANYKTKLYTHLKVSISLSATLINRNPFMQKMYEIAYPKLTRCNTLELDKYAKVYPVAYNFKEPSKIRLTEYGANNYSHNAFEKSIRYRPQVLKPYMGMIKYLVDIGYLSDFKEGDKLLIFAASIEFCTELTRYLKSCYPQFDVRRYVEDDPRENLLTAQICVSTIQSAGTAHDIPGLRSVIMTVNVDSMQANVQTLGRLRKLPDRDVKFYYLYCEQFEKHREYHKRRIELLTDRVASIKEMTYPHHL